MKDMTFIEWIIVAAIVIILVFTAMGYGNNKDEFKRVCDEAGGTTVWVGRQYQCVKR